MSFHFLNGTNYFLPYSDTGPGTIVVDPFANIWVTQGGADAMTLSSGPWTLKLNGSVQADDGYAVVLKDSGSFVSKVAIGAGGDIFASGGSVGIYAVHATNVSNAGKISADGIGIYEFGNGNFSIGNLKTGVIEGFNRGIDVISSGTHTIANAGTVTGLVAIAGGNGIEKVTNSGTLDGTVFLGGGNDIFTNFKTVGKHVKNGSVTGTIDLGAGNDHFFGGNSQELVYDGDGKDIIKFGGGNDHWIGYLGANGDLKDTIDGGKGIDTYDASQSGALGIRINLDSIVHFDSIRTVGLAALRADDFNDATPFDTVKNVENAYGSSGDDSIFGTKAANELAGGDGIDILYGLAGNDRLLGGNEADGLIGGAGRDELWGGADGSGDLFVFRSLKDSGPTQATRDTIMDFGVGDIIDLHAINDKLGNIIHFLNNDVSFDGSAGALRAIFNGDDTIVQLDVNGDRKADFSIALDGHHTLADTDFNL